MSYTNDGISSKMESKLNISESVIAGGVSGAFTRAVAQPLDVLKIRFQLQLEPIIQGSKYSSIFQAVGSIIRDEGITTLWSGHIPAQFLSVTFGVVQFASYEMLTNEFKEYDSQFYNSNKHWINFSNGAVSAMVATLVSFPFDTMRTRLVAEQKTNKVYKGVVHACRSIVRQEGFLALFKGLTPTLGAVAPYAGTSFAVYKLFTDVFLPQIHFFQRKNNSSVKVTTFGNVLSGFATGIVAKTVIYPCDLVKKRLQIQGFQQYRKAFGRQIYCKGMFHCIKLTIAEEGFLALYKGYLPGMIKSAVVTALQFATYDEIKHLLLLLKS